MGSIFHWTMMLGKRVSNPPHHLQSPLQLELSMQHVLKVLVPPPTNNTIAMDFFANRFTCRKCCPSNFGCPRLTPRRSLRWLAGKATMKVVSPITVKFRWFSIAMVVFGGVTCWVRNHFEEKVCKLGRFLKTSRKRPNKQIPFAVKTRFDKIYQGNMTLRQVHGHPCKTSPLRVLWTNCWAVGWWLKHSEAPQIWQEVIPAPCNSGVGEA